MISPRLAIAATVLTIAVAVPSVVAADAASAAPKSFANCTAVHAVYSGGIARVGVKYNTVTSKGKVTHRALKGKVKFDTALYNANKKSDRDGDGIACELD